jgi:hypothetical protein
MDIHSKRRIPKSLDERIYCSIGFLLVFLLTGTQRALAMSEREGALSLFFELAAHADEADESTTITFSQPIQIPGRVLPAGTYVFKLASTDDLNVVQVFNADRTVLYANLQTIATDRPEPTDHGAVALAEQRAG